MIRSLVARVRQGIAQLDLYGLPGAAPEYHHGMRALWLDNVLTAISGASLFTYVPLYALALGASSTQIGTLSSAASLAGAVAPIPGAQLTERWGSRRRVVVVVWSIARAFSLAVLLIPFFLRGVVAVYGAIVLWALCAGLANLAHPAWSRSLPRPRHLPDAVVPSSRATRGWPWPRCSLSPLPGS
jgi:MFS family permease